MTFLKRSFALLLSLIVIFSCCVQISAVDATYSLDLRILLGDSYIEENPYDYIEQITKQLDYMEIPFASTWSIDFQPSIARVGPLPDDSCTLSNDNYCSDTVCGSNCVNDTSTLIHHRNAIKNLHVVKENINNAAYDIVLVIIASPMCGIFWNKTTNQNEHSRGLLGLTYRSDDDAIIYNNSYHTMNVRIRTMQHETSHMFGCGDGECATGEPCVMNGGYDGESLYITDIWCSNCRLKFNPQTH